MGNRMSQGPSLSRGSSNPSLNRQSGGRSLGQGGTKPSAVKPSKAAPVKKESPEKPRKEKGFSLFGKKKKAVKEIYPEDVRQEKPNASASKSRNFYDETSASGGFDIDLNTASGFDMNPNAGNGFDMNLNAGNGFDMNLNTGNGFDMNPNTGNGFDMNLNAGNGFDMNPNAGNGFDMNPNAGNGFDMNPNAGNGFDMNPNAGNGFEQEMHVSDPAAAPENNNFQPENTGFVMYDAPEPAYEETELIGGEFFGAAAPVSTPQSAKEPEPSESLTADSDDKEPIPEETEPEVSEPEVSEPEVSEPEVSEPEVSEPEVSEPEVSEAEVSEPEVSEPEVSEPEVSEPEVSEPEVSEPEVSEPEVSEPEVSEPELSEPEVSEPEVSEPEIETAAAEPEKTEEPEPVQQAVPEPAVKPTAPIPPSFDNGFFITPPLYNNQKPIARTVAPTALDPDKAEILERADSRSSGERGRSSARRERPEKSRSVSRREKPQRYPRKEAPAERTDRRRARERSTYYEEPAYEQNNVQNTPLYQNPDLQGMTFMPPYQQQVSDPKMGTADFNAGGMNMNYAPSTMNTANTMNASGSIHHANSVPDPDRPLRERARDNSRNMMQDERRLRDQSPNRRSTDSLIFGAIPRATMSLIFLVALIIVTGIFSVINLEVTIPVLVIIMVIEVIMGIFLAHMPSFVSILVAAGLTVVGALTGFLIPVCIGNAVMLSAGLVIKGE